MFAPAQILLVNSGGMCFDYLKIKWVDKCFSTETNKKNEYKILLS